MNTTGVFRLFLFLSLAAICPEIYSANEAIKANENLLARLDSIIARHDEIAERKEARTAELRDALEKPKPAQEKLEVMRRLYEEYLVYDSDSAMHYATECCALAELCDANNYELITDWRRNKAFIYIVQGLYDKAMEMLKSIDSSRLSAEKRLQYYSMMEYAYSMRSVYLRSNHDIWKEDIGQAQMYLDSIQQLKLPHDNSLLWVPVAMSVYTDPHGFNSEDVALLREHVDSETAASRENAINAYWLARHYGTTGETTLMLRYMTMAATYDALIMNKEIAALQELAMWLFDNGELNRAYNYLLYAVNQANAYHNRYRMVSLSDVLPTVRDAYRAEVELRDKRLSASVIILVILTVILVCSIAVIAAEYRKLKRARNMLSVLNDELRSTVAERDGAIGKLEKANTELSAANSQKLRVLAYAFRLTTEYINALEDYRKKLLRKYKVKRIDDLGALINDPELIKEQYQSFYEGFDKTVLSIFPDFVEEYNRSAGEDGRISAEAVAKSGSLNTKLRIHALRRLGVDKSADIARMLNVSIRTVYNNRNSTGNPTHPGQVR